jgi:RimJ/RimL family protein N-acetyltransferase
MWRRKREAVTPRPAPLRVLRSERLTLVAATAGLVGADLAGADALAGALEAEVTAEWPPELFSSAAMRLILAQLEDPAEQGWSAWYLLSREQGVDTLVGLCQFKGRPDHAGAVEIAYSVLPAFRDHGYATEAVARLVEWAFGHRNVTGIVAETLPHNRRSIRIMEKNGFVFTGPGSEQGIVRYELSKSRR